LFVELSSGVGALEAGPPETFFDSVYERRLEGFAPDQSEIAV